MTASIASLRERVIQFAAKPVPFESTELGTIYLRRITLGELDSMQKKDPAQDSIPLSIRLLARFIGDEQGKPMFNVDSAADRELLQQVPVAAASDILRHGNELNKLGGEEEPKKG